jgi:hypothetical protein
LGVSFHWTPGLAGKGYLAPVVWKDAMPGCGIAEIPVSFQLPVFVRHS